MATPAFRAVGTGVFPANSIPDPSTLACTAPAGRVVGDLLVGVTWCRSITATVATPSGWNLVAGFPKRSGTASGGSIYVFTRYADGTSSDNFSPSWSGVTTGTSGDASGAVIIAYSGLSQTLDSTPNFIGAATQTSQTTFTGITTAVNNSMAILIAMKLAESAGQTSTVATFTERYDNQTTSGTGHIEEISDSLRTSAGATGDPTITWSNVTSARTFGGVLAFLAIGSVAPAGVGSGEAFGTDDVLLGLGAAGIASAQAFGAASALRVAAPTGILSGETFSSADRVLRVLAAAGIGTGQIVASPALMRLLAPGGIGSRETFGAPALIRFVTAAAIAPGGAGTPAAVRMIAPTAIASSESFGLPSLGTAFHPVDSNVLVSDKLLYAAQVSDALLVSVIVSDMLADSVVVSEG